MFIYNMQATTIQPYQKINFQSKSTQNNQCCNYRGMNHLNVKAFNVKHIHSLIKDAIFQPTRIFTFMIHQLRIP
jgi:hypothetical protein